MKLGILIVKDELYDIVLSLINNLKISNLGIIDSNYIKNNMKKEKIFYSVRRMNKISLSESKTFLLMVDDNLINNLKKELDELKKEDYIFLTINIENLVGSFNCEFTD